MSDGAASTSAAAAAPVTSGLRFMSSYQRADFVAQELMIEILPKFEMGQIEFMCGKYGPFSPNYPAAVPLWLALFLRETNTCTIRASRTMSAGELSKMVQFENDHPGTFGNLPTNFFSMMRQLLRFAASDLPDAAQVHRLLDELEQRRIGKITQSIGALASADTLPPPAFNAGHLTTSELLVIKNTLGRVVNDGVELRARADQRLYRQPGAAPAPPPSFFGGSSGISAGGVTPGPRGGSAVDTSSSTGGGRTTLLHAQQLLRGADLASTALSDSAARGGRMMMDRDDGVDTYFGGDPGKSLGFVDAQSMADLSSQGNNNRNLSQQTNSTQHQLMFASQQSTQQQLPPAPAPKAKRSLRR